METKQDESSLAILMPMLQYRWRVDFATQDQEAKQMLARQATNVVTDYVNKTISMSFEQNSTNGALHTFFHSIGGAYQTIRVECLAGDDEPTFAMVYRAELISHKFELDYSKAGAATHDVTFKIVSMTPYEPNLDEIRAKFKALTSRTN